MLHQSKVILGSKKLANCAAPLFLAVATETVTFLNKRINNDRTDAKIFNEILSKDPSRCNCIRWDL